MPANYGFSSRNSPVAIGYYGTNGSGGLSADYLYARKWTIGIRVDELDVSTFEEGGFTNYEDGLMDADISFDGFWSIYFDSTGITTASSGSVFDNAPATSGHASIVTNASLPPLMYPGASYYSSYFFVKGRSSSIGSGFQNAINGFSANSRPAYRFPKMKVFGCSVDSAVRGTLDVAFNAKNQGYFLLPGQAAPGSDQNARNIWH